MRAAASSTASGSPSRRAQISSTADAFSSVSAKRGSAPRARSTKSATASSRSSGSSGYSCSPETRSAERLVTRNERPGAPSSTSDSTGAASASCSKLSITSSAWRPARRSARFSASERSPLSFTATASAIAGSSSAGSRIASSATKKAPSTSSSARMFAASIASLVLPEPPGPVSVSTRVGPRSALVTSSSSRLRPTSVLARTGTLLCGRGRRESVSSWRRIACSSSRSSGPGSSPRSSRSMSRAAWYASSASA